MPFDGITASHMAEELRQSLTGARLDRIFQPGRYELLLHFRMPGHNHRLFLSADPQMAAVYLSDRPRENPKQPPAFCQVLRKHLSGAILEDVQTPPCERVLSFHFRALNALGDAVSKQLVAEVMGRHSNLLLLSEEQIIHDAIRHVDGSVNRVRESMPARPYQAPPAQDKLLPEELLKEKPEQSFHFLEADALQNSQVEKALLQSLAGFSPVLCRELLFRTGLEARRLLGTLSSAERWQLSTALRHLLLDIQEKKSGGFLFYASEGAKEPLDFHALPLQQFPHLKAYSSLSAAMDHYLGAKREGLVFRSKKQSLERQLRQAQKANARKFDWHRQDQAEGAQAEKLKKEAELLKSQLYLLSPKASSVSLVDYYDPEQKSITLSLDPSLSPAMQVKTRFKRYHRAKQKAKLSQAFLAEDAAMAEWLASLETALNLAEEPVDLLAIQEELSSLKKRPSQAPASESKHQRKQRLNPGKPGRKGKYQTRARKSRKQVASTPLPPRRFESSDGFLIEVGRNNIQNDRLSLRKARKDALWFHAQQLPGAHVVLHSQGKDIPAQSLLEAAQLAAFYSAAGGKKGQGSKVTVDYCPVKQVSKPKGAKPGKVIYQGQQSIRVEARIPKTLRDLSSEGSPQS